MHRIIRLLLIALSTCVSAAVVHAQDKPKGEKNLQPHQWSKVQPLHVFDNVYLAGQPTPLDLLHAKKDGVSVVINLREKGEIDWDEEEEVKRLEMKYVLIPFKSAEVLKDEHFDQARRVLKESKKETVLLHCSTSNRVGAIWLAHRVLDHGVKYEEALAEAKKVGLKSQPLIDKAKNYIERKNPKSESRNPKQIRMSKSQTRNPNLEIRNKSECRNHKSETLRDVIRVSDW